MRIQRTFARALQPARRGMNLLLALSSWVRRDAACILDGDQLSDLFARVRRRPLGSLDEHLSAGNRSVALLLDHAHGGAADALRLVQRRHAEHFDAGAVVIGVENLPRDDGAALDSWRRMARAPVFGVDLRKAVDVLLLDEALIATRAAATLRPRVRSENKVMQMDASRYTWP